MASFPVRVMRIIARMNVGGPALQVVALTEGLRPPEFASCLLSGSVGYDEADYVALRAPGLPLRTIPGLGRSVNLGNDLGALVAIIREMRRFKPDIVHTHTAKAGLLGRVAARICGVPILVHTFHGHLLQGYFSPLVSAAITQTERVLARSTTRLVSVGVRVRDELLAAGIGNPGQYSVVAPGIALAPLPTRQVARTTLGLPLQGRIVLFVARLTSVKRPERFVEVAAALRDAYPDVTFAIIGDGALLAGLRAQADACGANVRFLGWRADVEAAYSAADLIVLTSDNEGMPVSLIEAAMAGCPAVATDVGSVREVVLDGRTGLVVPVNASAVAAGVRRLLDNSELRARLGAAAVEHANREFSRKRLVDDTARLYRDLIVFGT